MGDRSSSSGSGSGAHTPPDGINIHGETTISSRELEELRQLRQATELALREIRLHSNPNPNPNPAGVGAGVAAVPPTNPSALAAALLDSGNTSLSRSFFLRLVLFG